MPPLTQPPDPQPRRPRTACPPGAIDCHIHLFGPAERHPFHPDSKYVSADALPATHIALQDTLGLAGAVVVSGGGYGISHAHLAEVLEQHPGRFRGVALLPDDVSDAELRRLDGLGVRGARFVSPGHRGALPRLSPRLAARVAELGWHVQFYPAGDDLLQFADALAALPCPVVLDHFAAIPAAGGTGQPAFQRLLRLLDSGRFWVKLSGPMRCTPGDYPYAPVTPLARALVAAAPQRLLWGTDWPHVNMNGRAMPNDGDLFDLLAEWVPDADVRARILVDNPRSVYGWPPA
ncbi:amidohydrolase family protein [Ramlibacter sp. MAH-25]|uniref:Amidohydrolase family protein n=1 Tax=Ramlibacter pinisoli TaxID=2682844 RepID=A0A6N8IMF3_9BURK|nr:amidohydrolase family protein [Ramlibacter sp. CGMCC 1.13660]MVQ27954.1 amidohydrolase family protein [Ramlibacter pinisoli]